MIELGKVNTFIVERETGSGFYLKEIESGDEVFMPPALAPLKLSINQEIEAFVYLDTKGGVIASSEIPYAVVGEYALMRVVETTDFGVFVDWGIDKDLLIPENEQKTPIRDYEDHLIRVCLDRKTERVFGTTKLGAHIQDSDFDITDEDTVVIEPVIKTDYGYRVIINKKFIGMIYHSEIFKDIKIGKTYDAVVKKIREDGLVDVALQVQGVKNLFESKDKIITTLQKSKGKLSIHDKSSPDEIKSKLGMSKKTFKSAIGMLYKEKKINITKAGIELLEIKK